MSRLAGLGCLVALAAGAQAGANGKWPLLRHTNYVAWQGEAGQAVSARLRCAAHGQYGDELYARAIGPQGSEVAAEVVSPGKEIGLGVTPESTGLHLFQLRSGWNVATFELPERPYAYVAGEQAPLQTVGKVERLYFTVPAGVARFVVTVSASVKGEGLLLRVLDPAGGVALEREGDFDTPEKLRIPVAPEQAGRVWSVCVLRPKGPGLNLDDVILSLGAPVPPYLTERPEWAEQFGRK